MKKIDLYFAAFLVLLFGPFFVSEQLVDFYQTITHQHAILMSFIKFAVLATLGEVIGMRISEGCYLKKGFGLLPRALFWGLAGMSMKVAFTIFATGAPAFVSHYIIELPKSVLAGDLTGLKVLTAISISVSMNMIFAPIFMTLHKVSDIHIVETGGTLKGYFSKIDLAVKLKQIDWSVMWNFVFSKTIPLFWIPAHTITFLLPPQHRVLFAALLGIVLGVILAISSMSKKSKVAIA